MLYPVGRSGRDILRYLDGADMWLQVEFSVVFVYFVVFGLFHNETKQPITYSPLICMKNTELLGIMDVCIQVSFWTWQSIFEVMVIQKFQN